MEIVLTVLIFPTEIVLTVLMFSTEIVLTEIVRTVLIFLIEIVHTEIVLTVLIFSTEIVLAVLLFLTPDLLKKRLSGVDEDWNLKTRRATVYSADEGRTKSTSLGSVEDELLPPPARRGRLWSDVGCDNDAESTVILGTAEEIDSELSLDKLVLDVLADLPTNLKDVTGVAAGSTSAEKAQKARLSFQPPKKGKLPPTPKVAPPTLKVVPPWHPSLTSFLAFLFSLTSFFPSFLLSMTSFFPSFHDLLVSSTSLTPFFPSFPLSFFSPPRHHHHIALHTTPAPLPWAPTTTPFAICQRHRLPSSSFTALLLSLLEGVRGGKDERREMPSPSGTRGRKGRTAVPDGRTNTGYASSTGWVVHRTQVQGSDPRIYIYIYIYIIHTHTHIYLYLYISIYIYRYMCVCVDDIYIYIYIYIMYMYTIYS
jgi:hypothetical protein